MNHSRDMETIGERVKRIRATKGWSQADLVRNSKLPQSTVASIENDSRTKESSALIDVAHALGVDAYYLKTGLGEARQKKQLSLDEETILAGFSLLDPETREDWLNSAKRRIARHTEQTNAA